MGRANFGSKMMRKKGIVGRYWEIGPQKTLYVPKSILKQGNNEFIVFESDGIKGLPQIELCDTPDLG